MPEETNARGGLSFLFSADEKVFWEGNAMVSADEEGKMRTGAPTREAVFHEVCPATK